MTNHSAKRPVRRHAMRPLTREVLQRHLSRFLALDARTIGEPWSPSHWLLDLPAKWQLSRVLFTGRMLSGCIVVSRKGEGIHVHRIVVAEALRGRGLGTGLIREVAREAARAGYHVLSLKVHSTNKSARVWFEQLGLRVVQEDHNNLVMRGSCAELGTVKAIGCHDD